MGLCLIRARLQVKHRYKERFLPVRFHPENDKDVSCQKFVLFLINNYNIFNLVNL